MFINADFSRRAVIAPYQYQWVASPQTGVERMMLDRVGEEEARATSIVRYAADSCFPHHQHPGGEEILVLSGTFSDDEGHYPAGWYLRNPPGTGHQPFSREGATLFVKLRQMPPGEGRRVRMDTRTASSWQRRDGGEVCPLFSGAAEQVCLQRLPAGGKLMAATEGGAELLLLAGALTAEGQLYECGSWIRLPPGEHLEFTAATKGTTFYLKTGHLAGDI